MTALRGLPKTFPSHLFNLEFAISDIDRALCDAACEAVICWLEVFRKTSSIGNGPKLAAFPAYLGAANISA